MKKQATKENALVSLVDLIKIKSLRSEPEPGAPYGKGVRKALDYTLDLLTSFGAKTHNLDGYCGWAEFGEGDLFGILVHLDVVPDTGVWKYPPYSGIIDNGVVYGRGAVDDKGPTIAAIYALGMLIEEGLKPKKRIRIILGCDEESGWSDLDKYAETEEIPEVGISPDGDFPVIYSEKGVLHCKLILEKPDDIYSFVGGSAVNMVPDLAVVSVPFSEEVLQRALKMGLPTTMTGSSMLEDIAKNMEGEACLTAEDLIVITANGISAHGSRPHLGESAILKILECLHKSKVSETGTRFYNAFKDLDGSGLGIKVDGGKAGDLTLNVGKVSVEDGNLIFHLDIRHPANISKEEVMERILKSVPEAKNLEIINFHDPLYVDPDSELIQKLLRSYQKVTGDYKTEPKAIGGATFARFLKQGVAYGPTMPGTESPAHQPNESISLIDFYNLIDIYYEAFKDLLFS